MDALTFHDLTKHSPTSVRRAGHVLDWSNKPHPFKEYVDLEPIPLPPPSSDTAVPATDAIVGHRAGAALGLDLSELARLLVLGAGVLRERVFADGERFYFRTYACAGALYPVELYVACSDVADLEPGFYHFHPREQALRRLAAGDPRPQLAHACGDRGTVARAPATVVLTGIPWRTTWKYGPRGYRHLFWDAGMIVANLLALAASGGHPAEVVAGFADNDVNDLLGVDGRTEMALAAVPIAAPSDATTSVPLAAPSSRHEAAPLSARPRAYPELSAAHDDGALAPNDVASWQRPTARGETVPKPSACRDGIEGVIRRRGSSRAFARDPIPVNEFTDALVRAMQHVPSDWGSALVEVHAIVNAVEGLDPGAYRFAGDHLQLQRAGDFRDLAYWLCLEQPLGGDAAATLFLLADLQGIVSELGSRGYRAAQLEAGIRGGRLYLGAYACRFGATGLTFYDDEVRRFFETDLEPMLVVAVGRPARRRRLL